MKNLSDEWKKELGEDWERVHQTYLHTLGNLTLTGYNSEYSDKPFIDKLNMTGGFEESPLKLNKEVANKVRWGEEEIRQRAKILANHAVSVWSAPHLTDEELAEYKPSSQNTEYTIESHPNLAIEPTKKTI